MIVIECCGLCVDCCNTLWLSAAIFVVQCCYPLAEAEAKQELPPFPYVTSHRHMLFYVKSEAERNTS